MIRVHVLRPRLEGKLAGCPGGEPLALGLLEGGLGPFVPHPRPWQPAQGCVPQQRRGRLPASGGVCLEVGLCHGRCGSESIRGRKKTPPLTTLFTGSQFWRSKVKVPTDPVSGRGLFPGSWTAVFSLCPHMEEKVREFSKVSFITALILVTSERSHVQISSHRGLGLNM